MLCSPGATYLRVVICLGNSLSVGLMTNTVKHGPMRKSAAALLGNLQERRVDYGSGLQRANMLLAPIAVELLVNSVYGQPEVEAQTGSDLPSGRRTEGEKRVGGRGSSLTGRQEQP